MLDLFNEKKSSYKNPLNPKALFKWVFIDIIPASVPIFLTSDRTLSNYLLIVNTYSILLKLYGMEKITTEEVMDDLDMLQSKFGMIEEFGWRDLEIFSADSGSQSTSTKFKEECQTHGVHLDFSAPDHLEELLHQRLGQRSTRSLMAGDTANAWEDIEPIIYPDHFCTSYHIHSVNKKG